MMNSSWAAPYFQALISPPPKVISVMLCFFFVMAGALSYYSQAKSRILAAYPC